VNTEVTIEITMQAVKLIEVKFTELKKTMETIEEISESKFTEIVKAAETAKAAAEVAATEAGLVVFTATKVLTQLKNYKTEKKR